VDWDRAARFTDLTQFTSRLVRLRREHPVFRRRRFFQGRPVRGTGAEDIAWLTPAGEPMADQEWTSGPAHALSVFLNGAGVPEADAQGHRIRDDSFLLMVNPTGQEQAFTLPGADYGRCWSDCLDTTHPTGADPSGAARTHRSQEVLTLAPHALRLLTATS
jgi:glycogen operon protein